MIKKIFDKIETEEVLTKEEALTLLEIKNHSEEFYALLVKANAISRREYGKKGYLFAQIGLDSSPCSGNCVFCSLAKDNYVVDKTVNKTKIEILEEINNIDFHKISTLFLMTTAEYDYEAYLQIAQSVRQRIPAHIQLVANIGDFSQDYAKRLKATGFTGAYHIVRLREGVDTAIEKQQRIDTLEAIQATGLALYYCVEPIGREHTYEEIVEEMLRARDYHVDIMAVMRRVAVDGTRYEKDSEIDDFEFAKITAVTRLVTRPKCSMNAHEANMVTLLAGVNQLYAELGVNPRDRHYSTEDGRGSGVEKVEKMLKDAGYFLGDL